MLHYDLTDGITQIATENFSLFQHCLEVEWHTFCPWTYPLHIYVWVIWDARLWDTSFISVDDIFNWASLQTFPPLLVSSFTKIQKLDVDEAPSSDVKATRVITLQNVRVVMNDKPHCYKWNGHKINLNELSLCHYETFNSHPLQHKCVTFPRAAETSDIMLKLLWFLS